MSTPIPVSTPRITNQNVMEVFRKEHVSLCENDDASKITTGDVKMHIGFDLS